MPQQSFAFHFMHPSHDIPIPHSLSLHPIYINAAPATTNFKYIQKCTYPLRGK